MRTGRWTWTPVPKHCGNALEQFLMLMLGFYVLANFVFAILFYLIGPDQFNGVGKIRR
ncbi:MAG: hypothetical protein IPO07_06005 [Haliscomenobacter sp.]|nr:hypothetical protein [Haliscomenobacter sp.]MBK9488378.1 hypothetical protein [Haliscomenobacter sp.]